VEQWIVQSFYCSLPDRWRACRAMEAAVVALDLRDDADVQAGRGGVQRERAQVLPGGPGGARARPQRARRAAAEVLVQVHRPRRRAELPPRRASSEVG